MKAPPYRTDWHWGPVEFAGLFGLHGAFLCFHRHPDPENATATVDPAKPILPLDVPHPENLPDFIERN